MVFKKFFNKDADKVGLLSEKFGISPRVMDLIVSRGVSTEEDIKEYLNPTALADPFLLRGMQELIQRIRLAKELGDKVLIFGDYDVDGISATAIMIKALAQFGIKANHYLPNRFVDGYGLTNAVIDKIADLYNPNLIITVDCGISCHNEVEYAKTKGIEIVVTDHHEIPEVIPETIVINAKLPQQEFPFRELCGCGVAYKIAEALLGRVEAEQYLPIAAIATISDIVLLQGENRTIVTRGLKLCEKFLPQGLKMLFKEYEISLTKPDAVDISFKIAPKLNASGRMGDAGDSLKLYFETDPVKIKKCIEKIKAHNTRRQEICNKIYEDCERALSKQDMRMQRVICLASKSWDKGVLGIVCSRLVDKYHKPVFLFAQNGELLQGSGRSIDDINIHELLSSLQDILDTFGGHSMAAGLTLKRSNYEEFVQKINAFALQKVSDEVFIPIEYYDQEITAEQLTADFVKELTLLEPLGCGNPKPKFKISSSEVEIIPMKRFMQHAQIKIDGLDMTCFNFLPMQTKMSFSRTKSFIFELQSHSMKGVISKFDGGSFISEDAYKILDAIEISQLTYAAGGEAKFSLYPKSELLSFVGGTATSVFGTCFVTYNCHDYVNFSKNYNTKNIYHFGIYDTNEIGYNSLLLSPRGLDWAKNFSRIVFLSPVLDSAFISALNKVTKAEIYLPIEKEKSLRKFSGIDLSRETFGKVFNALRAKAGKSMASVFDLYEKIGFADVNFITFYSALLTFKQLNLIDYIEKDQFVVYLNKNEKHQLTDSRLYNTLNLLKNTYRRGNGEN